MTRLVLDCRWLGFAGVGRATEHLLRGLDRSPDRTQWVAWGPGLASELAPGLDRIPDEGDPRAWLGQRGVVRIPRGEGGVLFMHQTRPVLSPRCVTVIHDTTQLRTPASRATTAMRRAFLRRIARSSAGVITVSEWSRKRIAEDLGIPAARIRVVGNPADPAFGRRVHQLRRETARREMALYVGSFAPHKNIPRLVEAFSRTRFRRDGGELVLAGGRPDEAEHVRRGLAIADVTVLGRCPQAELERLFAQSRLLVQPSLEEGFGLPVWEAMSAGIPVCSSTGGALAEIGSGSVARFDPLSVEEMADALDRGIAAARDRDLEAERAASLAFLARSPDPERYALEMQTALLDLLEGPS